MRRPCLHLEPPFIAVVEQEQHLAADIGERLGHLGALHAFRVALATLQIREQFILDRRIETILGQFAVEAKGMIEIEVEGPHDAFGQIVERLPAVDLNVPVQFGPQRRPENVCGSTGHDLPPVVSIR